MTICCIVGVLVFITPSVQGRNAEGKNENIICLESSDITREFCTPSSFGLADYNYVEDVEICKQVGESSNGQATLSCKKAPLYQKDGQYYVKTPEATSKTKLEPAFKNGWYRNSSFSDHWTYSYQYKVGNWYFNL